MQVQVVRKHFHADIAVAVQIPVDADVLVLVLARVLHKRMKVESFRTASKRVARAGAGWGR